MVLDDERDGRRDNVRPGSAPGGNPCGNQQLIIALCSIVFVKGYTDCGPFTPAGQGYHRSSRSIVARCAIPDERISDQPQLLQRLYRLKRRMAITPERQAETYVFLAADPAVQTVTGGYWDENNRQVRSNQKSYNRVTWEKLWRESERLAGIKMDSARTRE